MPKDGTEPLPPPPSLPPTPQHPPPLKRGDACLYCRRRRIRCNAAKPTCQNCTKLRRECVYDVGKPVSRVRMLEERVAELEGYLRAVGNGNGNASGSGSASASHGRESGSLGGNGESSSTGGSMPTTTPAPAAPAPAPGIDWDTLDPALLSLITELSGASTSTTSASTHTRLPTAQQAALNQHLSEIPPMIGDIVQRVPVPAPAPVAGQGGNVPITSRTPMSLSLQDVSGLGYSNSASVSTPYAADPPTEPAAHGSKHGSAHDSSHHSAQLPRPQLGFSTAPVGGWWDPNDLPPETRDHLLGMFFNGIKLFKIFHVPRFMASLTLPASKRPHPCLLNAIYLNSASKSPNPSLRSLESHFLNIAIARLNEAVSSLDRLMDAVRAATILAVYRFQKNQYQAGIMMNAQAVQLAYTLGLHQITSNVWRPPREECAQPAMRQRKWMIGPPKDAVELGERINAFWAIYCVDKTAAIASQWPSAISDDDVLTPYPRPIYEYEMGLVGVKDDYSLRSMWDTTRPPQILPYHTLATHHIMFLRVISVLERASKLMYLPDEPGAVFPIEQCDFEHAYNSILFDIDGFLEESNTILHQSLPPVTSAAFDASRTPRIRTPQAAARVRQALESIERDLPPHQRTDWEKPHDGERGWWEFEIWTPEVAALFGMRGIAWMFLFDVYAPYADNTASVRIARKLTWGLRAKPLDQYKRSEEDLIISVCWSFISMIFVRELRRLSALGDLAQAAIIKTDLDTVIASLKALASVNPAVSGAGPELIPESVTGSSNSGTASGAASGPPSATPSGGPAPQPNTFPASGPAGSGPSSGTQTPADAAVSGVVFSCQRSQGVQRDGVPGEMELLVGVGLDLELELDM